MATDTSKLAPRIIVNERDLSLKSRRQVKPPVTLLFGFSPVGRTCEMVECNNAYDILSEFGQPSSAPEKYFIDAGLRLVQNGATALMTRLPYDNAQSHTVKYVDYKIEDAIAMSDIVTVPQETAVRRKDDVAVTVLKELHRIDPSLNQVQRISQVVGDDGCLVHSMTNEKLVQLELDPQDILPKNTFRIVDIKGHPYGFGAGKLNDRPQESTGIFPMVVSAPMALYYQGRIENTTQMDKVFALVDISEGIQSGTAWCRDSDPIDDEYKKFQAELVASIDRELNFNASTNRFHRSMSFQDECMKTFPMMNMIGKNKLDKVHARNIGILVCAFEWNDDEQKTNVRVLESFVGALGRTRNGVDRKINEKSKYIRMYKNVPKLRQTDCFVADHEKIATLGMEGSECLKYINYKTSIIDPINYVLESIYSDVDSIQIDVILDAGLSSTAFQAYVNKTSDGESFVENDKVRTMVDWRRGEYRPVDYIAEYAKVWGEITALFGDFIKTVRGDCVYIADGPRILNLERNYPIQNYTEMENVEMFNRYLPYFNGYTNNYVAKYFNWVYMEDMQYENRGLWVPGSVVMGSQLALNDKNGQVWYAPAGQTRGIVPNAYNVSVKTKQYNSENDLLYQNNWNFFNIYQNEGVVVEGQKTLQTRKTSLDRLNTRRMVCYIKQQARKIANKYKYEPHTNVARTSFRNEIVEMLREIQRTSGISDYRVVCNDTNNTVETIDRHELHMKMAIKPIKAIEYIIIDLDVINGKVGIGDEVVAKLG